DTKTLAIYGVDITQENLQYKTIGQSHLEERLDKIQNVEKQQENETNDWIITAEV
ncbi:hypothetical protein BgiBS90_004542, partial [Biomphalaria glabrata]